MSGNNGFSGSMLFSIRYQQMLHREYEMSRQPSKNQFQIIKETKIEIKKQEEERRSLEENARAMREVQQRQCLLNNHELEKQDAYFKREHKRLLAGAEEFIMEDKRGQIKNLSVYVKEYCSKMDEVEEKLPIPVKGLVISKVDMERILLKK